MMSHDPWTVDPAVLGEEVADCLRALVNCWVREELPTRDVVDRAAKAQISLGYLVTRARDPQERSSLARLRDTLV